MRLTQYIGLNDYARKLVMKASKTETIKIYEGLCGEPVKGGVFYVPSDTSEGTLLVYREEVQVTPWSCGPMIFTHLALWKIVHSDGTESSSYDGETFYCSWMLDPAVKAQEYDSATGRYFV